ncbi:hypothetical protein SAMN02745108_01875 [Fibrobacter intestinalis]|uniref:Uncharacterized protein n=1 Tax=Fibrobacter intestinalis TaxID=28122 RepID=A0A1T4PE96_9BACT|nr:hypothetical protein BGW94_2769 [Fibrobacter sp. NR9]SJZ89138.1 hypothetical protein SAMN02745108_01875 [Fibrobacter intestinalis]
MGVRITYGVTFCLVIGTMQELKIIMNRISKEQWKNLIIIKKGFIRNMNVN